MRRLIIRLGVMAIALVVVFFTKGMSYLNGGKTASKVTQTKPDKQISATLTDETKKGQSNAQISGKPATSGYRIAAFRNLQFEIPLDWIEERANDYQNVYYINNVGIYVGNEEGVGDVYNKEDRDQIFKASMQDVEYKDLQPEEEIMVAGEKGYLYKFTYIYEGKEYDSEYVLFGNAKKAGDIFYTELKELNKKNRPVFEHMLKTVRFMN